jgi:hypothetical protein
MTTKNLIWRLSLKIDNVFHRILAYFRPQRNEGNVTSVVFRLLRASGTKITFRSLYESLKTHPKYPTLKSVCDFLDDINIVNYPLRIEESELFSVNGYFIAHTKESGGKIMMVHSVDKEKIVYSDSLVGKKSLPIAEFFEKWDGVIIIVEPSGTSGEENYTEKRRIEIINDSLLPFAIFVMCFTIIIGAIKNEWLFTAPNPLLIVLFITHSVGLVFSILLFRHELEIKTKFTEKLCHIASNADCEAVTKSKASKAYGNISWADIGVTYFTGGLIASFIVNDISVLNCLSLFSIASLPYPVFSILYQWIKIKKWCPLCLSVQFVLIVESIFFINVMDINKISIIVLADLIIVFSVVFITVLLLKNLMISQKERDYLKLEELKTIRDPELFRFRLSKGEKIEIPSNDSALIFGNIHSKTLVTVFLSFYCSACSKKFNEIKKLIEKYPEIKIQLVFSPYKDETSTKLFKIILGFMRSGQYQRIIEILDSWYNTEKNKRAGLLVDYQIFEDQASLESFLDYNSALYKNGKITKVPTVYYNCYPLPSAYKLEDIGYHLTGLEKIEYELSDLLIYK